MPTPDSFRSLFDGSVGCGVLATALLFAGCSKPNKEASPSALQPTNADAASAEASSSPAPARNPALKAPPPGPPVVLNGQTIDVQKAEKALASSYKLQAVLADVRDSLRYTDFPAAVAKLQQIAAHPNLTDEQRRTVAEVMEQVKQASNAKR